MGEPEIRRAIKEEIAADWVAFTGGPPVVAVLGVYEPGDVEGVVVRDPETERGGVLTWWADGERAEIVSVHAEPPGIGTGTRLMDAAEEELCRRGVKRIELATTNDNLRALKFYVRRGYRLVRVDLDAMDRVRRIKPGVPHMGRDGLPLCDMWVLEKTL